MDKALENIMILLQRRYNFLREIGRLTDELAEATERRDTVSASLLLEMRGEQMERHAACEGELRRQTEEEISLRRKLYAIALGPISQARRLDGRRQSGPGRYDTEDQGNPGADTVSDRTDTRKRQYACKKG